MTPTRFFVSFKSALDIMMIYGVLVGGLGSKERYGHRRHRGTKQSMWAERITERSGQVRGSGAVRGRSIKRLSGAERGAGTERRAG